MARSKKATWFFVTILMVSAVALGIGILLVQKSNANSRNIVTVTNLSHETIEDVRLVDGYDQELKRVGILNPNETMSYEIVDEGAIRLHFHNVNGVEYSDLVVGYAHRGMKSVGVAVMYSDGEFVINK